MNVEIKVITRAKKKEIRPEGDGLKVKLVAAPRDGKANEELTLYLAEFFGVKRSDIKIVNGEKDKRKVVSIPVDKAEFERRLACAGPV